MKYISKTNNSYRVHIPLPNGKAIHRRVSFKKIGKEQAEQKALHIRDELGREHWGVFWDTLLEDSKLLQRLPKTLEPILRQESDEYGNPRLIYRSMWTERNSKGEMTRKCFKRSTLAHGYNGAYELCKSALMKAYQEYLPLILFMKSSGSERYADLTI